MIRCAMFDFGNVLMRFETQKFYDFLRAHQLPVPGAGNPEEIFKSELIAEFDLGTITTDQMFDRVKAGLALNVGRTEFLSRYTEVMHPDQKMVQLRQMLKENGVKMAVVSNINVHHFHYVQLMYPEVFADFDYLMLSYQHGFKKPDHRMWEVPARELGVSPKECFFIDDLVSNINAFREWSRHKGTAHHYDVVDDRFRPNGRLEIERNKLLLTMVRAGMLNVNQAGGIARIDF